MGPALQVELRGYSEEPIGTLGRRGRTYTWSAFDLQGLLLVLSRAGLSSHFLFFIKHREDTHYCFVWEDTLLCGPAKHCYGASILLLYNTIGQHYLATRLRFALEATSRLLSHYLEAHRSGWMSIQGGLSHTCWMEKVVVVVASAYWAFCHCTYSLHFLHTQSYYFDHELSPYIVNPKEIDLIPILQ